jgi:hypothetical protein
MDSHLLEGVSHCVTNDVLTVVVTGESLSYPRVQSDLTDSTQLNSRRTFGSCPPPLLRLLHRCPSWGCPFLHCCQCKVAIPSFASSHSDLIAAAQIQCVCALFFSGKGKVAVGQVVCCVKASSIMSIFLSFLVSNKL